jgi:hypothetical protein
VVKLVSASAVVGQFYYPHYSLKWATRRLFCHCQENIQPFLARKLAIECTVSFFGLGEIAKLDGFLLHQRIIAFLRESPIAVFNEFPAGTGDRAPSSAARAENDGK